MVVNNRSSDAIIPMHRSSLIIIIKDNCNQIDNHCHLTIFWISWGTKLKPHPTKSESFKIATICLWYIPLGLCAPCNFTRECFCVNEISFARFDLVHILYDCENTVLVWGIVVFLVWPNYFESERIFSVFLFFWKDIVFVGWDRNLPWVIWDVLCVPQHSHHWVLHLQPKDAKTRSAPPKIRNLQRSSQDPAL